MTQEAITHIDQIPTPAVLIETRKLEQNLRAMQAHCEKGGAELWPHCKTHKLVPILQRQLAHGAQGATCAKLSEAEALLPSGVRRIFVAHSLAFPLIGPRV
ncbi:MAG: alanine racemase, partial [Chthoniobacterales bacterium]